MPMMFIFPFWIFAAFFFVMFVFKFLRRFRSELKDESKKEEQLTEDQKIYRLADKNKGILTASDLVLSLGYDHKKAQKILEEMAVNDNTSVVMDVENDGVMVFKFREIERKYKNKTISGS